ncbi:MAG TPA: glutamate--tRNA ligase [Candidatus Eremiobacteraceae bacterium]
MSALVRVRFAPAPTGSLHVGGARTALFNYLFARGRSGTLVLRSEDTDLTRSSIESERVIEDDLHWLGLDWDEGVDRGGPYGPYRQTERRDRYGLAAARLLETEAAYPCYCTPEELEADRSAAEARGQAPKYSGRCRDLTQAQRSALESEGRKPAIRFRMPERDVYVEDLVRGSVHFPAGSIGDFVIVKSDGNAAYNFAAVIDDSEMAITHVIRGDEHLPNTPRQVSLYEALELPLPLFAHVSMILAPDHQKLSKRHGATALSEYREQGFLAPALVNYLALLGWSPGDDRELFTLDELTRAFSIERVSKSPAVFDHAKLRWFNAHYLRALPLEGRADLFVAWAARDPRIARSPELSDQRWRKRLAAAIGDHVEILSDVAPAVEELLRDDVTLGDTAREALKEGSARSLLSDLADVARHSNADGFEGATSREGLSELGRRHGVKGKALFQPIRLAVTGTEHGIELPLLLPLLGPARVASRIASALSQDS